MTPLAQLQPQWPAISELLDEALQLPAAARGDWLASLSGARAEHRGVLTDLLATQAGVETDDFLAELPRLPGISTDEPAHPATQGAAGRLEAGGLVGPYRLIEQIGRGGMATVWLAERADGLVSRRVALKLPHAVWGDSFADRLARERDILATFSHEHIARLYDVGIDSHGRPYLAMEFVEGEAIDAYCRTHELPVRERIALLLQVMSAVAHAHARLVVHRDLKPSNILVSKEGQVRLLDFGIAKLLEGERTRETALTELGGRALTLDYASPEQIRGEPLSTASDVYSMAVVAYEVLAGSRPYRLKRGSAAELEEAIADAEPRLASDAATTPAARKSLRGDLDAILHRALKKSTVQRYLSVESFAQDLQHYLRGEPVTAQPDSRRYRVAKFVGRNLPAVTMTSALAIAVAVGAAVSLWQAQVARHQERVTDDEFQGAGAVRELYMETMRRLAVIGVDHPEELARPKAITFALRRQLDDMAPMLKGRPRERDAQMYAVTLQLGYAEEFEAALKVGTEYLAGLKAHDAPPREIIEAYGLLGGYLFRLRRLDECEAMRRAGVAWSPDTSDEITELYRQKVASGLGSILRVRGKRKEAQAVFAHAEAVMAQRLPNEAFRFENLKQFSMFWLGWDEVRALRYARLAHTGVFTIPDSNPDQKAQAQRELGYALEADGHASEAEPEARASLAGFVAVYGAGNRNSLRALAAVADSISRQGDTTRSEAFLAAQRTSLTDLPGGLSSSMARVLREQHLENAWLSGDTSSAIAQLGVDTTSLLTPAALANNDLSFFWPLRALDLAGRPREALAALLAYRKTVSPPDSATLVWIRTLEIQAMLELAAGEPANARGTTSNLLAMLTREKATTGRAFLGAAELSALAAARLGATADAALALALTDKSPAPVGFPSRVERAESEIRRGEVMVALGRNGDAAAQGTAALADLVGQKPDSPRLVQAHRLVLSR
jgi:serine/threonine protein kinase